MPRSCHRQPTDVRTQREEACWKLFPPSLTAPLSALLCDHRRCEDTSARPDLQSRGLLQQCPLWRLWSPLQSVLNTAARLITGKRKFDHIASTMHDDLHWLPVRQRILFKLSTLISKCLHRTAPSYLTDMCIPVSTASGRSCLQSCSCRDLRILRCRLSRYRSRSFSVSGPAAWNSLPTAVRDLSSSSCFCRHLTTELFSRAYGVN